MDFRCGVELRTSRSIKGIRIGLTIDPLRLLSDFVTNQKNSEYTTEHLQHIHTLADLVSFVATYELCFANFIVDKYPRKHRFAAVSISLLYSFTVCLFLSIKSGALFVSEVLKYGHVVYKGASHSWAYKEREYNSCSHCQVPVNREKWASFPSFYTPLPRLSL